MGCLNGTNADSPESRVQDATAKLFLNNFSCSDYKAAFFLKNTGGCITDKAWREGFDALRTDLQNLLTNFKGPSKEQETEHKELVDKLMASFKCPKVKGNFSFYDWMYAAFWFSSDTPENKCSSLIQTWSTANEINGDFDAKQVTAMLEHFWDVWTRVSCHLGQHTKDQCQENFQTVLTDLGKAQAKGFKLIDVQHGTQKVVTDSMVEQTNKHNMGTAALWRTGNLGPTWNVAETFVQKKEETKEEKKAREDKEALTAATKAVTDAEAALKAAKEGDDKSKLEEAVTAAKAALEKLQPKKEEGGDKEE